MNRKDNKTGRYTFDRIEKTMHEKSRLSILTSLFVNAKGLSFNELKELCDMTDGNLSRHLQILKEAGLLSVEKSFRDNKSHTHCRLTGEGRDRFLDYVKDLETIVKETARAERESTELRNEDLAYS